ncbi:MAG: sugar phosphate isomerase/epimerase [Spirochaetales bacterium]|nr:sugar phosphate isomerase/epimerase [Spirochaetales bacterium]
MEKVKCGVITGFLGQTKDRFREYNQPATLEEKFAMVSEMKDVDGVEIVYPYEVSDAEKVKKLIADNGLKIAAINCNIKSEPEFVSGGITSENKEIRQKAIRFVKEAKDFAKAVGADKVQCCPLGDGYEFSFQENYAKAWKNMADGFAEAGDYMPEIPLFLEYKPSEVRGACFLDSAAKTLYMLEQIGNRNMGVTMDFGHSLYGGENPAEALCLIAESKFPYYIHINDNNRKWDWDYIVASHNFLAYAEFLYYLQEYGYDDYLTSDTSPQRLDIKKTFEANARWTNKLWNLVRGFDRAEFKKRMANSDYLDMWKYLEDEMFFRNEK